MNKQIEVVILLSTYNGEKYVEEQLESLFSQTYDNIKICIRDDGSSDSTLAIFEKYKSHMNVAVLNGKNKGYKKSFLEMLYTVPDADIYMFCDQDDVWEKDKVQVAVEKLKKIAIPAIYTSNVRYCDETLQVLGESRFHDNANIWKALLYNQAVGCTIAMNNALRQKIMEVSLNEIDFNNVYSHDCWVYRICLAVGGINVFDETPHILYRQHGDNQIGGSASFWGTWKNRLKKIGQRHIKQRLALELEKCYGKLIVDDENREAVCAVAHYKGIYSKVCILRHKEIYTESWIDNLGIIIAILCSIA